MSQSIFCIKYSLDSREDKMVVSESKKTGSAVRKGLRDNISLLEDLTKILLTCRLLKPNIGAYSDGSNKQLDSPSKVVDTATPRG